MLLAVGLVGGAAWWAWQEPARQPNDRRVADAARRPDRTPAASKTAESSPDASKSKAAIEAAVAFEVARRNQESKQQREAFLKAGWEFVEVSDPPEEKLMGLDPEFLGSERERDLQVQIQSNSYAGEDLRKVHRIAALAEDTRTRFVAIEAIGRADSELASELLIDLFQATRDPVDREQILGYLKPRSPGDPVSDFLIGQLDNPELSHDMKVQAMAPLAAMILVTPVTGTPETPDEPPAVLSRIPSEWQDEFQGLLTAMRTGRTLARGE